MTNEVTLKGSANILFIHDGTAYLPIGCLTTNGTQEAVETSTGTVTKCNPNPEPVMGAYSYSKSFGGEAVENNSTLASMKKVKEIFRTKAAAKETIFWKEETTFSNDTKETEYGEGVLTEFSYDAPADGVITFSGSIQGKGDISVTDLVPVTTTTTTV